MTPKDLLPLFRLETIPRNAFVLERKMLEEIGFAP
jgi:hypothetical protein